MNTNLGVFNTSSYSSTSSSSSSDSLSAITENYPNYVPHIKTIMRLYHKNITWSKALKLMVKYTYSIIEKKDSTKAALEQSLLNLINSVPSLKGAKDELSDEAYRAIIEKIDAQYRLLFHRLHKARQKKCVIL